jgi:hypothetical protein
MKLTKRHHQTISSSSSVVEKQRDATQESLALQILK